jgi:hypothetical protein
MNFGKKSGMTVSDSLSLQHSHINLVRAGSMYAEQEIKISGY